MLTATVSAIARTGEIVVTTAIVEVEVQGEAEAQTIAPARAADNLDTLKATAI